jgi:hypothetical protein
MYLRWTWDSSFVKEKGAENTKKKCIIWKYEDTDTTLVYDPTKKKRKEKKRKGKLLIKEVEVAESQASITRTGIRT